MTPTDLTNLVLGMMFDDEFANAHIYVPRLRLAPLKASIGHWFEEKRQSTLEPPPHEFTKAGDGEPALLGDVLDCIFDWKVRYGTIDFEHKDLDAHLSDAGQVIDGEVDPTINWGEVDPKLYLYVKNFNMTVSRPLDEVLIDLDAAVVQWRLVYAHPRPDLEALADEECRRNGWPLDGMIEQEAEDGTKYKICLRPRPDSFLEPYMTSSRAISDTSLDALADVLRGAPWDEDADPEEIVAPYDQLEEVEA